MNEALREELIVIDSIYPNQVSLLDGSQSTCLVRVPDSGVELYLSFDAAYPVTSPHVTGVSGAEKQKYQGIIDDLIGGEVLFSFLSTLQESQTPTEAEVAVDEVQEVDVPEIVWSFSETLQDRKSTFIGRACHVTSEKELHCALASIDAKRATHPKIWACRFTDANGKLVQANEDDGESAAGGRLAFLLEVTKAEDVLVVVSRWFGGVLLGDVRFKHISTVAREALDHGGFLNKSTLSTKH